LDLVIPTLRGAKLEESAGGRANVPGEEKRIPDKGFNDSGKKGARLVVRAPFAGEAKFQEELNLG
jgi:hypothetical protein